MTTFEAVVTVPEFTIPTTKVKLLIDPVAQTIITTAKNRRMLCYALKQFIDSAEGEELRRYPPPYMTGFRSWTVTFVEGWDEA